jgi:glucokinase
LIFAYFGTIQFPVMSRSNVVAGVDIGGTNTVFALVDSAGRILETGSAPTNSASTAEEYVKSVCGKIRSLLNSYDLKAVGIGAPNGNYFNGTIEFAPNLPWKGVIRLADLFREQLHVPAFVTNDANAAAIGELYFGAAKDIKDFIFITLGTGLGSGIVVGGNLVYGHDGFAGEVGHTIVFPNGRPCGCGRNGCLEQYCSATGIVKTYLELIGNQPASETTITSKTIFDRAMNGEKAALDAFEFTGEVLGLVLANSVAYTSPKAIFLFGGLTNAGELIFAPTQESFEKNVLTIYKNKVSILPSGLPEHDAPLLGAASLAWNELKKS